MGVPSGWVEGAPVPPDVLPIALHTRAVLRKFDGDDQTKPPVEVLLIEDGQITGHWAGEEVIHAPHE